MPVLETHPPDFTPTGRYMEERMKVVDESHNTGFLEPEEVKCNSDRPGIRAPGLLFKSARVATCYTVELLIMH
jgi:hypothetical protein